MSRKCMIKEMPDDWKLAKYYFPGFEMGKSRVFEIIFSRLCDGEYMNVELRIPEKMKGKDMHLYYSDGKGNFHLIKTMQKNNTLYFSTMKVGLYILEEKVENKVSKRLSKILMSASNLSKNIKF